MSIIQILECCKSKKAKKEEKKINTEKRIDQLSLQIISSKRLTKKSYANVKQHSNNTTYFISKQLTDKQQRVIIIQIPMNQF